MGLSQQIMILRLCYTFISHTHHTPYGTSHKGKWYANSTFFLFLFQSSNPCSRCDMNILSYDVSCLLCLSSKKASYSISYLNRGQEDPFLNDPRSRSTSASPVSLFNLVSHWNSHIPRHCTVTLKECFCLACFWKWKQILDNVLWVASRPWYKI